MEKKSSSSACNCIYALRCSNTCISGYRLEYARCAFRMKFHYIMVDMQPIMGIEVLFLGSSELVFFFIFFLSDRFCIMQNKTKINWKNFCL